MSKLGFRLVGFSFLSIVLLFVLWQLLPITITRYSDIKFANRVISNLEEYKRLNGLPETDDWVELKKLGFKDYGDYLLPHYQKLNAEVYEVRFIEGFDGPYLIWNSQKKIWKVTNPTFPDNWNKK